MVHIYLLGLFKIINAAITPGIHPHIVRIKTINIDPHPLSRTARGGIIMAKSTRKQPIQIALIFIEQSSEKIMSKKK